MDELLDVLNEETGEKTSETIMKFEAHSKGIWHGAIHILIVNKDKTKTLLQKRSADKKLYANTWDIAVGGHISSGEDDLTSAKRELEEEIGINPDNVELIKVDRIKEQLDNGGVLSNEFVSIFIAYADINIEDIKLQEEEVSDAAWFTYSELEKLIEENKVIPHTKEYEILKNIMIS